MGKLGFGVMVNMLVGNGASVAAFSNAIGKVITSLELKGDALALKFADGYGIEIYDDGQSCCESRYMTTDDNLADFVGATLLGGEVKEAPDIECEWGDHEVAFLEITTDRGVFSMANHNENNGYYGGFSIRVRVTAEPQAAEEDAGK